MAKTEKEIPSAERGLKDGERRFTIIAPNDTINKVKYIAWHDRMKFEKTAFVDALNSYVAAWEKKNGAITPALIKKMEG